MLSENLNREPENLNKEEMKQLGRMGRYGAERFVGLSAIKCGGLKVYG